MFDVKDYTYDELKEMEKTIASRKKEIRKDMLDAKKAEAEAYAKNGRTELASLGENAEGTPVMFLYKGETVEGSLIRVSEKSFTAKADVDGEEKTLRRDYKFYRGIS